MDALICARYDVLKLDIVKREMYDDAKSSAHLNIPTELAVSPILGAWRSKRLSS